jgi:hypothetical protein
MHGVGARASLGQKENFDRFVERRLVPANQARGLNRTTEITVTPLLQPLRSAARRAPRPRQLAARRAEGLSALSHALILVGRFVRPSDG